MRIVAALGGNALLRRGEKPDAVIQIEHVRAAAEALAPLAADHELIVCHGNGPQVGMLALESENDPALTRPYPLDALGAQTQGMIGYWLAQCLHNAGVTKPVLSIVTQTLVDAHDPAFAEPAKFVGPVYDHPHARRLAELHGWHVAADGDNWRRVVPSPEPQRIIEQDSITHLLENRAVVICGGGGGAPVIDDGTGRLQGVEAVVDKDFTAALLAVTVHADRLLVLTDVPAVMAHFGTPQAVPLNRLDLDDLARMRFPAGSMGPKIAACHRFVAATGRRAAIGSLSEATAVLDGSAGTTITAGRTHRTDTRPGRGPGPASKPVPTNATGQGRG
ncbi:carbamate kinase [Streptomyces sp. NPDC017991]|uniref:carbamate kinase n=1 Tax=Streptomyces sp. NPDC017991 TaxID=3365026 RepID=UPI0037AB318B